MIPALARGLAMVILPGGEENGWTSAIIEY